MEHIPLNETESHSETFPVEPSLKKTSGLSLFIDLLSGACVPDNL